MSKFTKIRLFVCPNFSPPSHIQILNLITFLESLHHGGANEIISSPLKAKKEKKLACKLFFSNRNVFLYVTEFFLYVTYKSKCQSKTKFYCSMQIYIEQIVFENMIGSVSATDLVV